MKCDRTKPVSMVRLRDEYSSLRNINAMAQDAVGRGWIATEQGLFIGNTINDRIYLVQPVNILNDSIHDECVQAVFCDENGIWIGTKNYGAFHLSVDGELTGYNLVNGKLNYDNELCFYQDSNGQFKNGTQVEGLSRYDRKADRF